MSELRIAALMDAAASASREALFRALQEAVSGLIDIHYQHPAAQASVVLGRIREAL